MTKLKTTEKPLYLLSRLDSVPYGSEEKNGISRIVLRRGKQKVKSFFAKTILPLAFLQFYDIVYA